MTSSDEQHTQDDEVFTQIQPQITIVTNTNAKFPYLKKREYGIWAMKMQNYITNSDLPCWNIVLNGNSHKKTTKDSNGNIKICPLVSAEEHLAVQRETKARTTLLTALPDNHMGDFYHLDDAKEIWLAIKARFGGNEESKKMQSSFLKQEALPPSWSQVTLVLKTKGGLEYLSFDDLYNKLKSLEFDVKGYAPKPSSLANAAFVSTASTNNNNDTSSNHSPSYSISTSYSGNREASSSHGSVVNDVIHSFFAESEPKQQLAYEYLKQIERLNLEELDLKWQMAMLSIRVQKFEKKAGRKIKFNGQEAARFDKKLVQCYKCSQKGHFARECRAKASQDNHEDAHADEGALKIYGMIAGMESDPDSERKATSEYALMGFTTDKEVQTCSFECEYKYNELKKLYNEQREEISNSSVELNAYKSGVKTLEAQIRCHQKNQLAYEEKIRILKFDLEDKSNLLAYHEKLVANAAQEKQALQAKLDNEIANTANWLQSSKNLVKLIDSSISVKDKVGLGYGSYENELYIDNEPSIFDSRPEDWLGKPLYSWFTKEGDMHGVPPPMTGNYMPTPVHVEIDESQFSYGQKQTNISETSSENVETCESNGDESNESENNNFDSCESNFSVSTLESASETVVESEPNVVMSKVWTDAPIIEEVDSDNEYVVTPGKANEKPSHADNKSAKFINTPRDMGNKHDSRRHMGKQVGEGYAFPKKACFVCGSLSHLIKDCDFHEKRMAQEQAMAKQNEKTNGMGNFNRKWDKMTIWENTQRVDPSNKIVPRAVLLQSGIVDLSSTRPNLSTPVPTGRQNLSKPVTTGRRNLPTPVPTGKAVPAGRPNYPIPVTSGRTNNTVRPFPSVFKPNRPNTQSASPSKRPLHRASPPKTSFSYFGGDKVKTAVKTSAGCSWSSSRYVWKKNTKNNGGSNNNNRLQSKDPLGRPKPGNPHKLTEDLGIVDSGCSRSMTGNRHRLENFQEFKGGNVTFGGGEGKITGKGTIRTAKLDFENVLYVKELQHFNLFSVSQICDKKNRVLFTETECLVLTKDFKLPDETQVLLKVPRKHNLYSFNLEDLAPQGDLACLLAKATLDESTQWHRRLGHVNFKNMNKLVKGNLVRGLPPKLFQNDHTCVACNKGKQHKVSYKAKTAVSSFSEPLQMLHMDLFGPTSVRSISHKFYCLVITDAFSRFSWVFFLAKKDETVAERLGLEFAQAEEDLIFSAAKSFLTTSINASYSWLYTQLLLVHHFSWCTTVTPGTHLLLGNQLFMISAPFATSTSPNILSTGASSLRYPHPSTFANEFATGIPILKDIYDNPGSGMFTSSSYDDHEPRADLTNMSSTENVNPTSSKRVKSAHPSSLIIGDICNSPS
ncbi:putative ribonuclease H-like domain-containing protein [Tanacetum coccineum]